MSRRILLIEDDNDLLQELLKKPVGETHNYYGLAKSDELQGCKARKEVTDYMDKLIARQESEEKKYLIDIALIDLVLNEKPSIAYTKIKRANELEGIELFEKYGEFFRKKIFVTSAGNYRKAAEKGFNFNRPDIAEKGLNRLDIQVCLKTNPYEATEEERFPNNLIRAIKNAYAALDEEDAGQGEAHGES
ncbi:MAG: hypothetical protein P9F75_00400 [Candidatus Contendobacter sp.]|nr:hypothetical protein [Candidatus Contendobacter sp.]